MSENKKKIKQSTLLAWCGIVLAALATFAAVFVLNQLPRSLGTSTTNQITKPAVIFNQDLTGTWHSPQGFSAKIANGEIDLRFSSNGGDAVFWYGTFDSNPKANDSEIESIPVPGKIYWSVEQAKVFKYREDHITFEFSAAGVSKTVELSRG